MGPRLSHGRIDPEECELLLVADGRLPGSKDEAGCRVGEGRQHARRLALPEDFARRLVQGNQSPRRPRQEVVVRQIGDTLQADDAAPPAAPAGLQGEAIDGATSGLCDEEPAIGIDCRPAMLLNEGGIDGVGYRRFLTEPDDPPLEVGANHVSGDERNQSVAGPGGLAFAGGHLGLGRLHDRPPGEYAAGFGKEFHEAQRRNELLVGRPDREHEEASAVAKRIAGDRAAAIAEPEVAACFAIQANHPGAVPGDGGADVDSLPADQRPHGAGASRCPVENPSGPLLRPGRRR